MKCDKELAVCVCMCVYDQFDLYDVGSSGRRRRRNNNGSESITFLLRNCRHTTSKKFSNIANI